MERKAIIIGAGPAGLTAAYELLKRTDIKPVILEKSGDIGGISKTVNYKGNRIDIGGHRFFSKSDRVMKWWMQMMPVEVNGESEIHITYQNKSRDIKPASGAINIVGKDPDKVMLVRKRLSRIYFLRKFFAYPIQLSLDTLHKLGLWTTITIMFSYLKAQLLPKKSETTLEDFMINRFGKVLYNLFFKDYTEKVWGVPCHEIPSSWGAQRIKGVSISSAIKHAIQSASKRSRSSDISQKGTETSLIEQFLYPKHGPGQLWEEVARQVESMGGKILMHHDVKRIYTSDGDTRVVAIAAINNLTGETSYLEGDYFFSTMPVQELVCGMDAAVPQEVKDIAAGLQYRDFITVGILLRNLACQDRRTGEWKRLELKDTWIYIQEKDVKVGRLQLFNNWSPFMVKDPGTVWVGMEFFCNKGDNFWNRQDQEIIDLAIQELEKIGLATQASVLDATILRMEKTYPAYFGTYEHFDKIQEYVDRFANLFLVGRNGMHKYNNSDHSMLTAMVAVDNIADGITNKSNIWSINTEQEYHEEKNNKESGSAAAAETRIPELVEPLPGRKDATFMKFVGVDKGNRKLLLTAVFGIISQFILFKIFYPFPDFFSDSYSYIKAASLGLNTNIWPIGYSKFLVGIHLISHSDLVLTALQYFITELCALYFFFTLLYYYRPTKITTYTIFVFLFFNPLFLYISNYVSSDGLFLGGSLLWAAQLLWILNRPRFHHILTHGILLCLLFTIRYNAMWYPVITVFVYLFASTKIWHKLAGILVPLLLILVFYNYTKQENYKITKEKQFSVFSGWQLANNALYMYPGLQIKQNKVPVECRELDLITRKYFDSIPANLKDITPLEGAFYIKFPASPLRTYLSKRTNNAEDTSGGIRSWGSVSKIYTTYASFLIKENPWSYVKYYILPNSLNYFFPPLEKLELYNLGMDSVDPAATKWFDLKSTNIRSISRNFQGIILAVFPVFFLFLNICLIGIAIWLLLTNGIKKLSGPYHILFWFMVAFFTSNFAFSIVASPVVFRYQIFSLIVLLSTGLILTEEMDKAGCWKYEFLRNKRLGYLFGSNTQIANRNLATNGELSLKDFIFHNKHNVRFLWAAVIGIIIQFILFKLLYPSADFSNDSYTYIYVATVNDNVSFRPVGYSKFLRGFSAISTWDTLLVAFQYFIIAGSILYFFFSLLYFFKPNKLISIILFVALVFNPASLYLGNYISSDALFAGLSLIWITHLIWMINQPRTSDLLISGLLLFSILGLRYNALYYPVIGIIGFALSKQVMWRRISGILITIAATSTLIFAVANENYIVYKTPKFSAFGGWQMANNALYMYRNISISARKRNLGDNEFNKLDIITRKYFDTIPKADKYPPLIAADYLWNDHGPLKTYWFSYIKDHKKDSIQAWHEVGSILSGYGATLIKEYPRQFIQYFLLPNAKEYFFPHLEVFSRYNIGMDSVKPIAKEWFRYDSRKVGSILRNKQEELLKPIQILFCAINIIFILGLAIMYFLRRQLTKQGLYSILLLTILLAANFSFSVFAAPIAFRYQFFPMIVSTGLCAILIDLLLRRIKKNHEEKLKMWNSAEA